MTRSRQARNLARHLSQWADVEVHLTHDASNRWDLEWVDGPTFDQMRSVLQEAVTDPQFELMADRKTSLFRGESDRAWAATAVAEVLDNGLPADRHRAMRRVEELLATTQHPQHARQPDHEPMIEALLRHGRPFDMAEALATDPANTLAGEDATILRFPPGPARTVTGPRPDESDPHFDGPEVRPNPDPEHSAALSDTIPARSTAGRHLEPVEALPGVPTLPTDGVKVSTVPLDQLDALVAQLQREARAESTRRAYASDWRRYRAWAELHALDDDIAPAVTPTNVIRFLTSEATEGRALSTLERRLGTLSAIARRQGRRSLYDEPDVTEWLAGARGVASDTGADTQDQATALTIERLAETLSAMADDPSMTAARDRAILTVGVTGLLRRSEVAKLRLADIEAMPWGLKLAIRATKTNRTTAEPDHVALARLSEPALCPVRTLTSWLKIYDPEPTDVLFPRVRRGGHIADQSIELTGRTINNIVQDRTAAIAGTLDQYSGHSLRRGGATSLAQRGADLLTLCRAGRWSPTSKEPARYIEAANLARDTGAHLLDIELPTIELDADTNGRPGGSAHDDPGRRDHRA